MKLTSQLLVIGAVNTVVKINGDPWCTSREIQNLSGLTERRVSSSLESLVDKGLIEQYKEGYRQSIWIKGHDKFISLMENSGQPLFIVQDFRIKFANKKLFELISYTSDEIMSKSFIDFVHPDDSQIMFDRHSARIRGERVDNSYSFHFVDKDTSIKRVDVSVSNLACWECKPAMLTLIRELIAV